MKNNITNYNHKELFLLVDNTEKYYLLIPNLNKLTIKLNEDFIYKNSQLKYLINNI